MLQCQVDCRMANAHVDEISHSKATGDKIGRPVGASVTMEAAARSVSISRLHASSYHLAEGQQQTRAAQLQLPKAKAQCCLVAQVIYEPGADVLHALLAGQLR